jgi:lipopolysaccharide export LptBFGC system permease protein LptF
MQGFPWTLQKYIFREMGKTFLLTAAALSAILGLGGGVMQTLELGEVTPGQLLNILAIVIPVSGALTLPIAALFSAAATYGRISADNEFVACRSSGINLHILFLAPLSLSFVSAALTFLMINFLIPGMVRNLNEFMHADFGVLIQQRLSRPRGIALRNARVFAESSRVDAETGRITLEHATMVELDDDEWVRYGTVREVHLGIDDNKGRLRVYGWMEGVSLYDRKAGQFTDLARQELPASDLPMLVPQEVKFLTLIELLSYYGDPSQWREVSEAMMGLRISVGRAMLWDELWGQWQSGGGKTIELSDSETRLVVRSKRAGRLSQDDGIQLEDVHIEEYRGGRLRATYKANRAVIELARGESLTETRVRIDAYDVEGTADGATLARSQQSLGPVDLPPALVERVSQISDEQLLEGSFGSEDPKSPTARKRAAAIEARGETMRRIAATLSERAAFSVSVFVLVLLGAVLGIVFRGSQAMVSFGISFVPSLFVIITIVMGKQMALNSTTHGTGLALMWIGIAIVAVLDWWTMTKVLRR